jgi:hypothetical protein
VSAASGTAGLASCGRMLCSSTSWLAIMQCIFSLQCTRCIGSHRNQQLTIVCWCQTHLQALAALGALHPLRLLAPQQANSTSHQFGCCCKLHVQALAGLGGLLSSAATRTHQPGPAVQPGAAGPWHMRACSACAAAAGAAQRGSCSAAVRLGPGCV